MKSKRKTMFLITGFLFLSFAVFTAMVSFVDVQPIGPGGSSVGLASLNQFVFCRLGVHLLWYDITDWLGIAAVLTAFGFALLGLAQVMQRKRLLSVDHQILLLGGFYGLVAGVYVFFEYAAINYRPILLHTSLEVSYPSSHILVVLCVMVTAMIEFRRLLADKPLPRRILNGLSVLIMVVTVVGRLISGVHWFTDIVAGILLAAALIMLYCSAVRFAEGKPPANGRGAL